MGTLHNIVPKKNRIRKAFLQVRLHIWTKGYISCTHYDRILNKEISGWPYGLMFFIQILSTNVAIGLKKDSKGLQAIQSDRLGRDSIILSFKSLMAAHEVFSGQITIQQSLTEKKLIVQGDVQAGFSVLRSVILAQNIIFPKLTAKRSLREKCKKYFDRLRIFAGIFLIRKEEAIKSDSEVLRIFE